jgi:hypothetical protein
VTPAGARDPDQFCGTLAVTYIYRVWNKLTPAERAAVQKVLGESGPSRTARAFPSSPFGDTGRPHLMLAGLAAGASDPQPKFDYFKMAQDADAAIAGHLNVTPLHFGLDVAFDLPKNKLAKAETYSWNDQGQRVPDQCHIHVFDPMFEPYTAVDAASIMAHEMWHCYQENAVGNPEAFKAIRPWLMEGEADWVMATIVPAATAYAKDWNAYAMNRTRTFVERGQDGLGLYGHLADVAGNDKIVWNRMLPAARDGVGGADMNAFFTLTDGYRVPYYTSWAASYFLTSGRPNWTMSNPGTPPTSTPPPLTLAVNDTDVKVLPQIGFFQAETVTVQSNADILVIALDSGFARLHDEWFDVDQQMLASDVAALCLKSGGCTCPDGTPGASLATKRATAPISVGLEGADSTGLAVAAGRSLDEFCRKPDPPAPPPGPGGGGGGGGGGDAQPPQPHPDGGSHETDVHIRTLDGLRYDFQVIGEYTLVKSTVDDFAIQVRDVPVLKSRTVSVSQATAMKLAGHRVTATLEDSHVVVRIDGTIATEARIPIAGGSIERTTTMFGDGIRVEWPDGTTARVDQAGAYMLNTLVKPSGARRGTLVGLLGNDNGAPADDLVVNGVALPAPSADDIVHKLADAWRITQDTSLFDYAPGQSTASFTDPTFPDANVDPMHVPDRATAEQRCRQSGVTSPALLDNCIVDYGMTNDFLFTSVYSRQQQVEASRAALPQPTPGIERTIMFTGTVTDPAAHPHMQFMARAGDVVWLGYPDCADNYMQAAVIAPGGKGMGGGQICATGRLVLPETGDYELVDHHPTIPTGAFSIPLRVVRADRVATTSYGSVIAGRIETRGAHDVYIVDGHAGDVLRVSGEGCDLGPLVVSVVDAAGHDALGPNCRAGNDYRLPQDGRFKLVINGADSASGPYHFVLQGAPGSAGK